MCVLPNQKNIMLKYSCFFLLDFGGPCPRSGREAGLHQRALAQGFGLKCRIARRVIPMKKSADDDTLEMTSWPFLLPEDFEPCY